MRSLKNNWICFLLGASLWGGCKVGPDYHRPAVAGTNAIPTGFSGPAATNDSQWNIAAPAAHLPPGSWWQVFADPELSRLEVMAWANNPELAAALARFEQARAAIRVSRSQLFPQVEADPNYNRQRTSFNEPVNGGPAGIARTYSTFTFPLQAGWE